MPLSCVDLPADVVYLIFDHLRDLRDSLAVSHVSSTWRDIALKNSRLWSYINALQYRSSAHFSQALPVILARSRNQPLHFIFWQWREMWTLKAPLPSVLLSQVQRLRTLQLRLQDPSFLSETILDFPQLANLEVSILGGTVCTLNIRAPALTSLRLTSVRIADWEHVISPHLRTLRIGKLRVEDPGFMQLLNRCHDLEEFNVEDLDTAMLLEDQLPPGLDVVLPYCGLHSTLDTAERLCRTPRHTLFFRIGNSMPADDLAAFLPAWLSRYPHTFPTFLIIDDNGIGLHIPQTQRTNYPSFVGLMVEHRMLESRTAQPILSSLPNAMWPEIQGVSLQQHQWRCLASIPSLDHEDLAIEVTLDGVARSQFRLDAVIIAPRLQILRLSGPPTRCHPLRAWGVSVIARGLIETIRHRSDLIVLSVEAQLLANPGQDSKQKAFAEAKYLQADLLKHEQWEWVVRVEFNKWKA